MLAQGSGISEGSSQKITLFWLLTAYAAAVTPVQKVITMMEEMSAKGAAEKEAEIATYKEYVKFCDKTTFEKGVAIRDGKLAVEQGTAAAGKAKADAEAAADKIVEFNANIKAWALQKAESTKEREIEHADYETEHTEFTENIDAMTDAMAVIAASTQPVGALLQGDANSDLAGAWERLTQKLPANDRQELMSFLQVDAPQAASNAFESSDSTGGVQDAVGKLKERIEGKRADLEKEETEAKFAFETLIGQLDLNTEQAQNEIEEKTQSKAQRLADYESFTQEVEATSATLKMDEKYFADLEAQCTTKSEEFEARQKMREEELEAIAKAIEVMSGGTVAGAAEEHRLFLQTRQSFALLRAHAAAPSERSAAVHRVMIFLQGRAKKVESRILENLAAKVTAGGPFDKGVEMIKDLIEKLTTEAAEEADQKSWCDGELKANKETRDAKTEEVNRLTARSDMLHSQIAQLTSELEELSDQISSLNLALKEATEDRATEKAANDKAISDAKAAIPAVRSALKVLKDFYAKASTATAQQPSPAADAPGSWDTPYSGMGGSSKGVLGMIEVILADFVRLEQETTSSETEAQSAFDKFASDSNADIDSKTATSKEKETLKLSKTRDLEETGKDLKSTQKELDAALAYHNELKPSCVDAGVSFSERSQRRQEE